MDLSPFAPVFGPVLFAFPFTFAQELDARAVHQQVQWGVAGLVADLDLKRLLASTDRAEVRDRPVQPGQLQKAVHHAQGLAKGLAEQALYAQAELNRGIGERLVATPLAAGLGQPRHPPVQPHRQRSTGLQRRVVLGPVRRAVAGPHLLAFNHLVRLPAGRFALCNKAAVRDRDQAVGGEMFR